MGHLIKLVLLRVGNLTGDVRPHGRRGDWNAQSRGTGTKFITQHISEYRVSVFSQRFLIENCLDSDRYGCLFIYEQDVLGKGAVPFSKKPLLITLPIWQ